MLTVDYYNSWRDRLLDDYQYRNPRVVAALDLAEKVLDPGRLLDVGCGIGWTSSELARLGHTVTGIDISPVLIGTATDLFGDQCEFVCADFTHRYDDDTGFDSIVMVDAYEHLPSHARSQVHENLARLLHPGGRLLLTGPTPELQQTARERGIAMQLVDEDVTFDDLHRLVEDTGTRFRRLRRMSGLSSCGDYWHFLSERPC